MKTKLLLITSIIIVGCKLPSPKGEGKVNTSDNYSIITIDGCEYIEYDKGVFDQRVYSLTHKGDCKNPYHNTPYH